MSGPPIIPQQYPAPTLPHCLDPHHERSIQYHLCDYFSDSGECYPEVNFGDGPLDIVWVDDRYEGRRGTDHHRRTVGIETKRLPNISPAELRAQLQRYVNTKAYPGADFVTGHTGPESADKHSLLDEMWLAVPSDEVYETSAATGSVAYNRWTGRFSYEIDETAAETLRRVPYHEYAEDEALLGLLLWQYYRGAIDNPKKILAAEVKATKPQSRQIVHGELQTEVGADNRIDLVVGDLSYLDGFSMDDEIIGLEVKTGPKISDAARATEQLDTYVNSGLFSHVYLTVTQRLLQTDFKTIERILAETPRVGLREVALARDGGKPRISSVEDIQAAQRLEYQAMPIVSYGGEGPSYDYASDT